MSKKSTTNQWQSASSSIAKVWSSSKLSDEEERIGGVDELLVLIFWKMKLILSLISLRNFFLSFLDPCALPWSSPIDLSLGGIAAPIFAIAKLGPHKVASLAPTSTKPKHEVPHWATKHSHRPPHCQQIQQTKLCS